MSKMVRGESIQSVHELGAIADRVRERLARTAAEIVEIGRDLNRAKDLLPHGRFSDWLAEEIGLSHRLANQFMAAARRFGDEVEAVASLPGGVLLELAAPSTPDRLVDAVIEGRVPATVSAVRAQVRAHRQRGAPRRAARGFAEQLWSLPDLPNDAAPAIVEAVLAEGERDSENGFLVWFITTFDLVVEILKEDER